MQDSPSASCREPPDAATELERLHVVLEHALAAARLINPSTMPASYAAVQRLLSRLEYEIERAAQLQHH